MSELSNYLENILINTIFRSTAFTEPTVLAVCLLTEATDDAGTGTFSTGTGTEVADASGYARENNAAGTGNWDAPTNGDTANTSAITFTQASGSWGTIVAMAICDSITHDAGNMLFHSTVDTSRTIDSGDTAEFAAGAITVTFN